MSYFHDIEYITRLNFRLRNFKRRGDVFNFSCPLCGDSKKNLKKARGYIFKSKTTNTFLFKCYNCNESTSFSNFLKKMDPQYYLEYSTYTNPLFSGSHTQQPIITSNSENTIFAVSNTLITKDKLGKYFRKIENLPKNHFAIQYLMGRKIPKEKIDAEFYYTDDFRQSTIDILSDTQQPTESYLGLRPNDARIIIPFIDEDHRVLGYQGRTLNSENKIRYITIKVVPDSPKIYGLHTLDLTLDKIYVLEGPIDSMFIPNSVAVMDANLTKAEKMLFEKGIPKEKLILVFDNEPRSENIVRSMNLAIQNGFSIVILPEDKTESCKDINDLVKTKNLNTTEVLHLLEKNTYPNDTTARRFITQLEFNKWKKVS